MAEINFNNLYNQLSPMDKRYYDQQFSKNYVPGQENIMLSSQPAYEQMKAVYDAQQQVPEKSFFDFFNFGEASAAEKPQVPDLTYRNITPTFDLATGITNTTAASPFINTSDILNRYNVPGLRNQNLVDQIIKENLIKTNLSNIGTTNTADTAPFFFPTDRRIVPLKKPTRGIVDSTIASNLLYDDLPPLRGIDTSYGVANEPDVEQVESLGSSEPSGIAKLLQFINPFKKLDALKSLSRRIQQSDFGQSKNLMDYLDARKYGGRQKREDARAATMAQARGIQKKIDRGDFGGPSVSIDRGRTPQAREAAIRSRDLTGGPGKDYGPFSKR